uniref:Uncharacterized protein n=1 Tax=Ciona intestinalis TaxID=7719 RepID=H2Y328_CIOIN
MVFPTYFGFLGFTLRSLSSLVLRKTMPENTLFLLITLVLSLKFYRLNMKQISRRNLKMVSMSEVSFWKERVGTARQCRWESLFPKSSTTQFQFCG